MELNLDIIRTLLSIQHPYYMKGWMYCSIYMNKIVNDYKYKLLQIWCFPSLSIQQIMDKYTNVTMGQIIETSLYYYPISESLNYYPKLELLYNASNRGIANLDMFIGYEDTNEENNISSIILYKFNRITEYNICDDITFNCLKKIKLGLKLRSSEIGTVNCYTDIFSSFVLSLEETLELLVKLTDKDFYPLCEFGLSLCGKPNIEHRSVFGVVLNMLLGSDKISDILQRNNRPTKVNSSVGGLTKDQLRNLQENEMSCPIYSHYLNTQSVLYKRGNGDIKYIDKSEVCLHALESGDILSYIIHRDEGYLTPKSYSCWFAPRIEYSV